MMTVMTYLTLNQGDEPEWDRVMAVRLASASNRDGWIRGQILMPLDAMNKRVIVGSWRSRADWEAWHQDPAFTETSARLEALEAESSGPEWHEVVEDVKSRRLQRVFKAATASIVSKTSALLESARRSADGKALLRPPAD